MKNSTKFGAKVKTFIENCLKKKYILERVEKRKHKDIFLLLTCFFKRVLRKIFVEKCITY